MNFQQLTTKLFSAKGWPFYLVCIITILAEFFNAVLNMINSLIWWGRIDRDLIIIGSIDAIAVTLLIAPAIIYLIRHSFNLEEMNRHLQSEIDERIKTEAALRRNENTLRMITDNSRDSIWMADMEFRFNYLSPAVEQLLGYTVEEYLRVDFQKILTPSSFDLIFQTFTEEMALEELPSRNLFRSRTIETEQIRKDGKQIWVEMKVTFLRDADGKPIGILGFSRDITEHKKAEDALKESEEQYRLLFENLHDVVYSLDTNLKIISVSPSVEKRLGYTKDEFIGKFQSNISIFPKEELEKGAARMMQYLQGKSLPPEEFKVIAKDGTMKYAEISGAPMIRDGQVIGITAVARDITAQKEAEVERARLEEQLNQVRKLEAVGTLAGGIAHDFNNVLMGIQGFASLMLLEIDETHSHYEKLKNIETQVQSGADLTRQLLGFARGGRYEVKTTGLNEIVKKTSDMFGRTKKEIAIHSHYDWELWPVEIDRGQIEQVLLNLYVNAGHAMPGGGDLFLETKNVHLDESYTKRYSLTEGRYVKLSLTDTGVGMDEKTKARIFEPFFTTKEMGRGTGLGLAMVYGIIKGHQGTINVYSEKGHGTTFNIYLPASEKEIVETEEVRGQIIKGEETILLVDDEAMVLQVTAKLLTRLGYRIITANSGAEAIEICRSRNNAIDLLILDMIMPGMNGNETFDQIKIINPHMKVILSSGYSLNGQAASILNKGCRGFIQKPFNIAELSQSIRSALKN